MVAELIVGALSIAVAFIPKPTYYFGENLFGVRIIPYWIFECIQVAMGAYLIKDGLGSLI
jgi:hypothetical protein